MTLDLGSYRIAALALVLACGKGDALVMLKGVVAKDAHARDSNSRSTVHGRKRSLAKVPTRCYSLLPHGECFCERLYAFSSVPARFNKMK